MKIVILDAETLGDDLSLAPLCEIGEVVAYPSTSRKEIAARVADCDILVQNKVKIDEAVFSAAPRLRLVCEAATGYDNIDLAAARAHGVAVCNVPGYSTPSVVQLTLAMVLSLATNLPAFREAVASGSYTAGGKANILTPVYHELAGKTWGIVGYGNIGRGVGAVAEALGCRVVVSKRTPCADAECVSLDELCRISDIITVHTPLSAETRGLIDRRRIEMMKKDVIFVNVARGAVTDERAIADAVKEGRIGAFGSDVFSVEPFGEDHPFYEIKDLPNVCLTPHMAWGAYEARVRCLSEIVENIKAYQNGEIRSRVDLL